MNKTDKENHLNKIKKNPENLYNYFCQSSNGIINVWDKIEEKYPEYHFFSKEIFIKKKRWLQKNVNLNNEIKTLFQELEKIHDEKN